MCVCVCVCFALSACFAWIRFFCFWISMLYRQDIWLLDKYVKTLSKGSSCSLEKSPSYLNDATSAQINLENKTPLVRLFYYGRLSLSEHIQYFGIHVYDVLSRIGFVIKLRWGCVNPFNPVARCWESLYCFSNRKCK